MPSTDEKTSKLVQPTYAVTSADLPYMVLDRQDLPPELAGFERSQEGELDNATMAEHGIRKRSAESIREAGRSTGYVRHFAVRPRAPTLAREPSEVLEAATVVHLFDSPEQVQRWIDQTFVREFRQSVGHEDANGQRITGVELLDVEGFHDHAAGLLVVMEVPGATLASTIVDFRVGRILGVAYVTAKVDKAYAELTQDLALRLEKQIVRVVLGAA